MFRQEVGSVFWKGKRVFLTGHTGFKGSWLSLWLSRLGANVTGYALPAPTNPSLFELAKIEEVLVDSIIDDVQNLEVLKSAMLKSDPEIVIHMAAQPLVRKSYVDPVQTYNTNVMGTVNVLEAARACHSVKVILNVTTDKCYDNQEWSWGYRENDSLGGHDPYSSSKACSELITSAYYRSYFKSLGVQVATARAGNVIGGGDWAEDRLIPDLIRSLVANKPIHLRHPEAVRPWQHVLEPLSGYLYLCQRLFSEGEQYAQAWNFGPQDGDIKSVEWIVQQILSNWTTPHSGYQIIEGVLLHEAKMLKLDCSKANNELNWIPTWHIDKALEMTIHWFNAYLQGHNVRVLCNQQIDQYEIECDRKNQHYI